MKRKPERLKPISLAPLSEDEALSLLLKTPRPPERGKAGEVARKARKRKRKRR